MVAKVDVGVLSSDVAVDFLLRRGKKKLDDAQERAAAAKLAEELGFLPLALDHAASYCAGGRRVSFADYLGLYLGKLGHEPGGTSESKRHSSVRATFTLALERAINGDATLGVKACPEAGIVMGVAALLAPVPIPFSLFSHPRLAAADLDAAFRALADVSLIAVDADASAFTLHRVVQAIMRERLAEGGDIEQIAGLGVALLLQEFPSETDYRSWPLCAQLAPHIVSLLDQDSINSADRAHAGLVGYNLAKYYNDVLQPAEAEKWASYALETWSKTRSQGDTWTVNALYVLAMARGKQFAFTEAAEAFVKILEIDENRFGPNHTETGKTLAALADIYVSQGRYAEAEPLLKRSLSIYEKTVGGEHPDTSATLHELARLYQAQGRYTEAEPLLKRSLSIYEKTVGGEHPDTSATLHDLARLYQAQGRYPEAEPLLKRSLSIDEKTVGGEHPNTGITLRSLTELAIDAARAGEARAYLDRAWAVLAPHWQADHVRWAQVLNVAALVELAEGKARQAEATARAALERRLSTISPEHPDVAQSKWTLARVMLASGRVSEAQALLREAIAALEGKVTAEHVWLKGARATFAEAERGAPGAAARPPLALPDDKSGGASESWWQRIIGRRKG